MLGQEGWVKRGDGGSCWTKVLAAGQTPRSPVIGLGTGFGPDLSRYRFWTTFGPVLGLFGTGFGAVFGWFATAFGLGFDNLGPDWDWFFWGRLGPQSFCEWTKTPSQTARAWDRFLVHSH